MTKSFQKTSENKIDLRKSGSHDLKLLQTDFNPKFMEIKSPSENEKKSRYGRVQKELNIQIKSPKTKDHTLIGFFRLSPKSKDNQVKTKIETLADNLVKKNRNIMNNSQINNENTEEDTVKDEFPKFVVEDTNASHDLNAIQEIVSSDGLAKEDELNDSLESPDFELHEPSGKEIFKSTEDIPSFDHESPNKENLNNNLENESKNILNDLKTTVEISKSDDMTNINNNNNNVENITENISNLKHSKTDFEISVKENVNNNNLEGITEDLNKLNGSKQELNDLEAMDVSEEIVDQDSTNIDLELKAERSPDSKDSANGSSIDTEIISVKSGELYWAQIGSYPYWPCMISPDPDKKTVSYKDNFATKSHVSYHVRFFADNGRRSWVKEDRLLPYHGREPFVQRFSKITPKKKRNSIDFQHKLYRKTVNNKTWDLAIEEADSLVPYSLQERIKLFEAILDKSRNEVKAIRRLSKSSIYDSQDSLLSTQVQTNKRSRSMSTDSMSTTYSMTPPIKKRKSTVVFKEKDKDKDFKIFSDSLRNFLCNGKEDNKTMERWSSSVNIDELWTLFVESHDGMTDISQAKFTVKVSSTREKCLNPDIPSSEKKYIREFRGIDEVVDDIFNLGTEYLLEDLTNNIFCKFCKSTTSSETSHIIKCEKSCGNCFHASCLKGDVKQKRKKSERQSKSKTNVENDQSNNLTSICDECQADENHLNNCFVCKLPVKFIDDNVADEKSKCLTLNCGKYYHKSCLKMWPQSTWHTGSKQINFICPSHTCHTCVSDNPRGRSVQNSKTKFLKCVLCPASYHRSSACIPAGTQLINNTSIVCPRHDQNDKNHVNVNWCFFCAEGGELVCCETCPASVHVGCLSEPVPSEKYYCDDCESGRLPLYGELVWVRFGTHRWWPSLILPPTETPLNIRRMKHYPSEFVVRFFGTNDHAWISRSRVYLCQDDDWNVQQKNFSSKEGRFIKGIQEAKRIMEIIKTRKLKLEMTDSSSDDVHIPLPYVKVKINKVVSPVKWSDLYDEDKVINCNCSKDIEHPCGPDTGCLNRSLLIECDPKTCPAGDRCENQLFEKRLHPKMKIKYLSGKGFGLIAMENIAAGTFICEYAGEIIDNKEYQRRLQQQAYEKNDDYYFLTLQHNYYIDAGPKGNIGRFMNHSCDPNCESQKWSVRGITRIGLFAIRDISEHEELTFNYMFQSDSHNKKICFCKTSKCSGFIGVKYSEKPVEVKKNKKSELSGKQKK